MAALLYEDRPSGEPTMSMACALPLGRVFAFDEIGWLETEALAARLRAAWPMRDAAAVAVIADVPRAAPAFRRLAAHPRLLAAALPHLPAGASARTAGSWLAFGAGLPPDAAPGAVRIVVEIGGAAAADQRGLASLLLDAPLPQASPGAIRFVIDFVAETVATAPRRSLADDALWPCALACAG